MKNLTKNNLLKFIEMKKRYEAGNGEDKTLLAEINNYIANCINKSDCYFSFLSKCDFSNEQLRYLI